MVLSTLHATYPTGLQVDESIVSRPSCARKSSSVISTFCPSLRFITHGIFTDPHPVCRATALDRDPRVPDTFSVEDGEHMSDVSTEIKNQSIGWSSP